MNPLLRAMHALGGSGSTDEIYDKVVEVEHLPEDVLAQPHDPDKSNQTEVAYRLAWARTYLKKYGLLENSSRGVWSLTPKAKDVAKLNPADVVRAVKAADKKDAGIKDSAELRRKTFLRNRNGRRNCTSSLHKRSRPPPSSDWCNGCSGNPVSFRWR